MSVVVNLSDVLRLSERQMFEWFVANMQPIPETEFYETGFRFRITIGSVTLYSSSSTGLYYQMKVLADMEMRKAS